ncbi:MAG TPA: TIGR03435 family protein [Bryobacteraceae bacterium]
MRKNLLALGAFGSRSRLRGRIEALLAHGRVFGSASPSRAAASAGVLLALAIGASFAPRWIALAQTPPAFEVVSIRPSNPDKGFINSSTPSLNVDGDRYLRFVQITLRDLIMLAYGVGAPQVQGPSFLNGTPDSPADRFDVMAKTPSDATREQIPAMLRSLLTERFHLSFHRENKTMQIYALEVAKGGLKMKETPKDPAAVVTGQGRCERSFAEREGATLAAVCTRMTSAEIAQQLQALAPGYFRDGPVIDLTGLNTLYDFKLEWITAVEARNGSPGPTMMDAVQEQLGLKLERRRQPVEVLVIDKLDRTPTEN